VSAEIERRGIGSAGALEPTSFAEITQLAAYVAKSGLFAVKTAEAAAVVMLTGASLGISPVAALRGVHVIQGRAALDATLIAGLAQRHPDCEFWTVRECSNERCTIETRRRGSDPVTRTWTLDDAKRAGLAGKDNWKNYPAAMLRARCTAELARMVYPDALFGVYDPDELADSRPEKPRTIAAAVARSEPAAAPAVDAEFIVHQSPVASWLTAITDAVNVAALTGIGRSLRDEPATIRSAVRAAYEARLAELRGPTNDGNDSKRARKPAPESAPADEPENVNADPAPAQRVRGESVALMQWREHIAGKSAPQAVANSWAAHRAEFGGDTDAAHAITCTRLAAFTSVSDPVVMLAEACMRHDAKARVA